VDLLSPFRDRDLVGLERVRMRRVAGLERETRRLNAGVKV